MKYVIFISDLNENIIPTILAFIVLYAFTVFGAKTQGETDMGGSEISKYFSKVDFFFSSIVSA